MELVAERCGRCRSKACRHGNQLRSGHLAILNELARDLHEGILLELPDVVGFPAVLSQRTFVGRPVSVANPVPTFGLTAVLSIGRANSIESFLVLEEDLCLPVRTVVGGHVEAAVG